MLKHLIDIYGIQLLIQLKVIACHSTYTQDGWERQKCKFSFDVLQTFLRLRMHSTRNLHPWYKFSHYENFLYYKSKMESITKREKGFVCGSQVQQIHSEIEKIVSEINVLPLFLIETRKRNLKPSHFLDTFLNTNICNEKVCTFVMPQLLIT